jgi:hypothetical protein
MCLICVPYMCALYVCLICVPYTGSRALYVPYMCALYVCLICVPYMCALYRFEGPLTNLDKEAQEKNDSLTSVM